MASQGNPGKLGKSEGWETSEGEWVNSWRHLLLSEVPGRGKRRAHEALSSRRKEYMPLDDDGTLARLWQWV